MAITGTLVADFSDFNTQVDVADKKLQAFAGSSNKVSAALTQMQGSAGGAVGPVNSLRTVMGSFDATLNSMGVNVGPVARGLGELGDAAGKTVGELGLLGTAGLAVGAAFAGWKLGRVVSEALNLDKSIGDGIANLLGFGSAAEKAGIKADALALATERSGTSVTSYTDALRINNEFLGTWAVKAEDAAQKLLLLNAPEKLTGQIAAWDAEMLRVMDGGSLPTLNAALKAQDFTVKQLAETFGISEAALQHYVKGQRDAAAATAEGSKAFAIEIANQQQLDGLKDKIAKTDVSRTATTQATLATLWAAYGDAVDTSTQTTLSRQITAIDEWGARQSAAIDKQLAEHKISAAGAAAEYEALNAAWTAQLQRASDDAEAIVLENFRNMKAGGIDAADGCASAWSQAFNEIQGGIITWRSAMSEASAAIDGDLSSNIKNVQTLTGEFITAAQAKKNFDSGGSTDVTSQNFHQMVTNMNTHYGDVPGGGLFNPEAAANLASLGYSFAEIVQYLTNRGGGPIPPPRGPRIPGFAGGIDNFAGGLAIVGERGPELVNLPAGSGVSASGRGGGSVTVHIAAGAVVLQYPIMNDPQAKDALGQIVGDAVVQRLTALGYRAPLGARR